MHHPYPQKQLKGYEPTYNPKDRGDGSDEHDDAHYAGRQQGSRRRAKAELAENGRRVIEDSAYRPIRHVVS